MDEACLQKGDVLDGYRLIRQIGRGGFGEVWLCRSTAIGGYHALKFVSASDPDRIEKEFSALVLCRETAARIGSPHLVPIEHINRTDDGLYYIMPLADGTADLDPGDTAWRPTTLAELVAQRSAGPTWFSSEEIVCIMDPILTALQVLCDAGLVHRDVKPDNILFLNGRPCLGDISLLGPDAALITRRGTLGYAPPSWYLGGHPDMYGAAATLYTLLTGNLPDMMGRSAFLWPPQGESALSEPEREIWGKLHTLIRRAVEEEVSERFVDFNTMARALRNTLATPTSDARQPPPISERPQPARNDTPPPPIPTSQQPARSKSSKRNTGSHILGWTLGVIGLLLLALIGLTDLGSTPPDTKSPDAADTSRPADVKAPPSPPVAFKPPEVDRSPRDPRKGTSLSEDSRLAYNSLAWFATEEGPLTPAEREVLKNRLARIDTLISNGDDPDFKAAGRFVESCREEIPALGRSQNSRLAGLLLHYCGGDHDQARLAEGDPALQQLGGDELVYRVELMNRLRMDPGRMLNNIISSPKSGNLELVRTLMERARYRARFNDFDGARTDATNALRISEPNPALHAWVEAEFTALKRSNPELDR